MSNINFLAGVSEAHNTSPKTPLKVVFLLRLGGRGLRKRVD